MSVHSLHDQVISVALYEKNTTNQQQQEKLPGVTGLCILSLKGLEALDSPSNAFLVNPSWINDPSSLPNSNTADA